MLLTSLRVWQRSWKGFYKMASMNVSNIFTVTGLAQIYSCTRGLFWWKCSINECSVVYFSDISDSGNIFKLSHIFKLHCYSNGLPVVITDDHRASRTWWVWTPVVLQLMPGEAPNSLEALLCVQPLCCEVWSPLPMGWQLHWFVILLFILVFICVTTLQNLFNFSWFRAFLMCHNFYGSLPSLVAKRQLD